ncbi:hypothetical protein BN7_2369 [Wickerhamomyces ciferrii]|uniref:Uncharacterized protein n=1 Tax=Wickerhamomyces ciferrii (strain ATCC 14091 / BCRC 22168 / CBS 111 / JCM 3599 / NBRC 0793 / NRRL Y-1031 F-60-10) TaxID=1206466 RepID=K0KN91_WICCF|nr:uncharacterized protein BN7_2369 [Wickerhamomyces ciferrii]CCH42824.1 hypothetical protein BN7_2369 [Wickerhamomyces ciferrii]
MVCLSDLPDHCLEEIFIDHLNYQFEELKALYRIDKQFGSLLRKTVAIITNDVNLPNQEMTMVDGLDGLELKIVNEAALDDRYKFYIINYNLELGYDLKIFEKFNKDLNKGFKINFFSPNYILKTSYESGVTLKKHEIDCVDPNDSNNVIIDENKICKNLPDSVKQYFMGFNEFYIGSETNNLNDELKLRSADSLFNIKTNNLSKTIHSNTKKKHFNYYIKRMVITNYNGNCKTFEVTDLKLPNLEEIYFYSGVKKDTLIESTTLESNYYHDNNKQFEQHNLYSIKGCDFPKLEIFKLIKYSKIESIINSNFQTLKNLSLKNNLLLNIDQCEFPSLKTLKIEPLYDVQTALKNNPEINFDDEVIHFVNRYGLNYNEIKSLNFARILNTTFSSNFTKLTIPNVQYLKYFNKEFLLNLEIIEILNHGLSSPGTSIVIFGKFPINLQYELEFTNHSTYNSINSTKTIQDFFQKFIETSSNLLEINNSMNLFIPVKEFETKNKDIQNNTINNGFETNTFTSNLPTVCFQPVSGPFESSKTFYYCLLKKNNGNNNNNQSFSFSNTAHTSATGSGVRLF